jgi:hypothetical protein
MTNFELQNKLQDELNDINQQISLLEGRKQQIIKQLRECELMTILQQDGYFITDSEYEFDPDKVIQQTITLSVKIGLTTIGKPEEHEDEAEVWYYTDDKPSWAEYLKYPETPSDNFEIDSNSEWDSSGWDSPWTTTCYCIFNIYGLKCNAQAERGLYFEPDNANICYFIKEGSKYHLHEQDNTGTVEYCGIKFKVSKIIDSEFFDYCGVNFKLNKVIEGHHTVHHLTEQDKAKLGTIGPFSPPNTFILDTFDPSDYITINKLKNM